MKISVLTFNTNNKTITRRDLNVFKDNLTEDIIFMAFQESYLPFSKPTKLIKNIELTFSNYKVIAYKRLFGMISVILQKLTFEVPELKIECTRLGLGPLYLGNKGFVAIKLNNVIFINTHLPAHENNNIKRMEMADQIFGALKSRFGYEENYKTIIFAGDLNFRLVEEKVSELVAKENFKNYSSLLEYDQIIAFKQKFSSFEEGKIEFKPTYKYVVGSSLYSPKRFISYCDRILVASNYEKTIEGYNSIDSIILSDHRPVFVSIYINEKIVNKNFLIDNKKALCRNYKIKYFISEINSTLYEGINVIICLVILFIFLKYAVKYK